MSTNGPKDINGPRRPFAFPVEPEETLPPAQPQTEMRRAPRSFDQAEALTPEAEDPFTTDPALDATALPVAAPRARSRFSFAALSFSALGVFLSLAFGLWADEVIRSLFARTDWLGYLAVCALCVALLGLLVVVGRETRGLLRLSTVQAVKVAAAEARLSVHPTAARNAVGQLQSLLSHRAETVRGRAAIDATKDEIIDGPHLLDLAEREMLAPLDRKARLLILNASKRVSVVTAISPRAIVDLAYVLFEVTRLIRAMAELYGARPGKLGLLRLIRDVVAHLAVTGSIAVGDSLAQQVLGHGLASRLSRRLGEGVINGLLTARIGIAAMDLCRPLPFQALGRPGIGDFLSDIVSAGGVDEGSETVAKR